MQPKPARELVTFTWRSVTARISVIRNHRIDGWTLIRIRVTNPPHAPLPFAVNGYRTHGIDDDELDAAGDVVPFLTAWANRDAENPAYALAVAKWRQRDLFGDR
ncbi:conserved protein of unknown function [Candidatus Filomicrobium marinum]|uniref:Uncharacterized protein n=1 Tax=Candidatus Filomicrobium marinum TaxID=1608628 RepID=A0A0D6JCC8_9HYPH|nr:hypothetical protein [Candidatus Filomicrobium marinum]CFX05228.1 conserved protein of unknown function [Candidatus Filomicrobium marinum]CPR16201.1 conserved protein of unknown function [Candidatus Filomicrobium marinum]